MPLFKRSQSIPSSRKSANVPLPSDRIYLDYASATPLHPLAAAAMVRFQSEVFGNAGAIHREGQLAKAALETARTDVARLLQIQPTNVIFTSGGTESNNLALRGVVAATYRSGTPYHQMEIITTAIEHPATLRTVEHLARLGVVVQYVPVSRTGRMDEVQLRAHLTDQTLLVAVSYVNSEIGTIENIGSIHRAILEASKTKTSKPPLLFVDAAQAPLWLPCELSRYNVDLMSFDAGKFGGPKGIGILATGKGVILDPVTYGGGQEGGRRPGTEPLAQIVGAVTALTEAVTSYEARSVAVSTVRDYFIRALQKAIPDALLNGAVGNERVANNVNISIPGINSEFAVVVLDANGVAASTKSACSSVGGGESVVVRAITNDATRASTTLRFTLGAHTTTTEVNRVCAILQQNLDRLRIT